MKKIVIISLFLYCCMSSIYGFSQSSYIDVKVGNIIDNSYSDENTKSDINKHEIYDVDLSWGKMEFVFCETKDIFWDNKNNEYIVDSKEEWVSNTSEIYILNNSIKSIEVNFKYVGKEEYNMLKGMFSQNNINLKTNQSKTIKFYVEGDIPNTNYDKLKVGYVVLTVI